MQAQELSEANVKIGLLDKKIETADAECAKKVEVEREEVERFRAALDDQEMLVDVLKTGYYIHV